MLAQAMGRRTTVAPDAAMAAKSAGPYGSGLFVAVNSAPMALRPRRTSFRPAPSMIQRPEVANRGVPVAAAVGDRVAAQRPAPSAMRHGVKVFAWRPIAAGEEITIDYRLNAFDGDSWPCDCGAPSCTGTVVGSYFAMDPQRQRIYLPHAPAFIRREYLRRRRQG